jgi:hypothetical protein
VKDVLDDGDGDGDGDGDDDDDGGGDDDDACALLLGFEPVDASLVLREASVSVDVRHCRAYRHDCALDGCLGVEHPKTVLARESTAAEHTPPGVDLRHRTRLSTCVDGFRIAPRVPGSVWNARLFRGTVLAEVDERVENVAT